MNHLRELVDCMKSGKVFIDGDWLSEEKMDSVNKLVPSYAERAICFFGAVDSLLGITPVADLCKNMPFEVCWFEFNVIEEDKRWLIGVLVKTLDDGMLEFISFARLSGEPWILNSIIHTDGEVVRYNAQGSDHGCSGERIVYSVLALVRTYVTAMRCNNIIKHETVPSEKLQKARAKRGKKPLFSFWTLELKQSRADNECHGGTHSSPRLHLRRGHPRQYAPGKWTWVQPSIVGNKALGMVHKDYRLPA